MQTNTWDSRYAPERFFYGEQPNQFFASVIGELKPGRLLLPAEGEGRNAAYAARLGWEVHAFDTSKVARDKALAFAKRQQVSIRYDLLGAEDFQPEVGYFDAIGLIFTHFMPEIREPFFNNLMKSLKSGGILILEGFEKNQLNRNTGGPKVSEMLFSLDEIDLLFSQLNSRRRSHQTVVLSEGPGHDGEAEVVRYVGQKD